MAKSAVFIDLDRTLLCRASGQILNRALMDEGVLPEGRSLPGDKVLYAVNDCLGENLLSMGLVRAAARVAKGWEQEKVQAAGRRAVSALSGIVAPFAPQRLAAFRAEGHRLVLSTTTPADMIAPFAEAIGFDDLIATRYEVKDGRYTGRLYEGFVWGTGKLRAVRAWAEENRVDLVDCHACSDSIFDVPLLSSVGTSPCGQPRSVADLGGLGAAVAGGALGPPAGRPERRRARAVPHAPPVRPQAVVPLRRASTSREWSTCRSAARCCWPRTTAATSTWRHWRWWPGRSDVPCASSGRRRSSTHPSSGRSRGPSAASPSIAAAGRVSRCRQPSPR